MTLRTITNALCLLTVLLLAPATLRAEEEAGTPAARLAAAQADAVVSIQFVLKTRMNMMGQSRDSEKSTEVRGVLLDKGGLVLTASSHFEGGMTGTILRMMGQDIDVDATPSDIKVLFGDEEDEYPARLVAKDSDLGLAFVQITDLEDRKVQPLDLRGGVTPAVGQNLLGLTRMPRSFDCVPKVARLYVTSEVERPRFMWAVDGDFSAVGMPVFTEQGAIVGVLAMQQGTEGVASDDGGGLFGLGSADEMGLFVLPLSTVLPIVERAKAKAAEEPEEEDDDEEEDEDDGG